jgi:hypothetical protein
MGEKIVIGPIDGGLKNNRTAFAIDDDSFPFLVNAYQWRGRVKRKRGTSFLNRLQRIFNSGITFITLNGSGEGNLVTGFSLQPNSSIIPGTVTIVASSGPTVYTDPTLDGFLTPTGTGGVNTINYASGAIVIPSQAGNIITVVFTYYPTLPVLGIRDLVIPTSQFPGNLGFDTTYAYNIPTNFPYAPYDVSFYKNPPANGVTMPGYVAKTTLTPTTWNGNDYQQFWSTNYQGAFWVTNGIANPFNASIIGMQYNLIVTVTVTAGGPPAIVNLQITGHGLVVGDFLFINEVITTTGINLQTGYVIAVIDANNVTVEFPNATIAGNGTGGIAQYLTNRATPGIDSLRWYDGDPSSSSGLGWVNFSPPLSNAIYSIADEPPLIYYLVGAKMIFPFKDRLLFIGPVIQSKSGTPIYLQDTVIYSENGTAFYTSSFTGSVTNATTQFNPLLVPVNQTSSPLAYFEDVTGFGGFVSAGIDQQITTTSPNEDVLIMGFSGSIQTRFVYTGNDILPFNFYIINSELGSSSTFSSITTDEGVLSRGTRGFIKTGQTQAVRIDLDIPDQIFEVQNINNGSERFCAQRDFIKEWIYFTYNSNEFNLKFPNQTLQYNYRDDTWAIFNETYTTYGTFRKTTGYTWATIGTVYPTWNDWTTPWNSGSSNLLQPKVLAGNQQGFLIEREDDTGEANSLAIQNIAGNTVTSPDHSLNVGDYIVINNVIGATGTLVNGLVFSVVNPTQNDFMLNPSINALSYVGAGTIQRMYVPQIQTKQFPTSWGTARKTRLGPQQYLLSKTTNSQITLQIFLSQDEDNPYNNGTIVPVDGSTNNSLIYSSILYTCPESSNLGLTPANTNLQMPTARTQRQIWHRMNTSLIGDTVQIGFTLSDAQMRDPTLTYQFAEIELHSIILDVSSSSLLV